LFSVLGIVLFFDNLRIDARAGAFAPALVKTRFSIALGMRRACVLARMVQRTEAIA